MSSSTLSHQIAHTYSASAPRESESSARKSRVDPLAPLTPLAHTYSRTRFENTHKGVSRILVADNIKRCITKSPHLTHYIHHFGGPLPDAHLELQFVDQEQENPICTLPKNIVFLRYEKVKTDKLKNPIPVPHHYQALGDGEFHTLQNTIAALQEPLHRTSYGLFVAEDLFKVFPQIARDLPEGVHHLWFDFCGSLKPTYLPKLDATLKALEELPHTHRGFVCATLFNVARGLQGKHRHTKPILVPLKRLTPAKKLQTALLNSKKRPGRPRKTPPPQTLGPGLFASAEWVENHRRWVRKIKTQAPRVHNARVLMPYRNGASNMVLISLDPKGAPKPLRVTDPPPKQTLTELLNPAKTARRRGESTPPSHAGLQTV